jgi:hypothetical protein
MPFVPVPKDLTKVKTKVAPEPHEAPAHLFLHRGAIGIPTYLLTRTTIGSDVAVIVMIGLMLPFFFFAMYEKDGQPAEKAARNFLRAKLWPGVRPYKTENLYRYLEKEGTAIVHQNQTAGTAGKAAGSRRGKRRPQ